MIRDLMLLPGAPRRLLDDIGEMKDLMRELVATNERELAVIRGGMEEVAEAVPEIGKGPLEKAKDALSG
jgi:hypothetical protein